MRVAFLVTGNGGNLKFLHLINKVVFDSGLDIFVIADRPCGALKFAQTNNLESRLISVKRNDQKNLLEALTLYSPDLIITNIHKILERELVESMEEKMINLHYSLLPRYAGTIGTRGVELATLNRDYLLGVTTHRLDEIVDNGEPIIQSIFKNPNDLILSSKISFRVGCQHLFTTAQKMLYPSSKIQMVPVENVLDELIHHFPPIAPLPPSVNEFFWQKLSNI